MASFQLSLQGLAPDVKQLSFHLGSDFFNAVAATEVSDASVDAQVVASHKDAGVWELEMTCKGYLMIPCDRCLQPMRHEVDTVYRLSLDHSGSELDDSVDGVLRVPASMRELDLEPLLRDTVLLTIPIMHVHPEGECDAAMLKLLRQHKPADSIEEDGGAGDAAAVDPRWEALRKLKTNNEK